MDVIEVESQRFFSVEDSDDFPTDMLLPRDDCKLASSPTLPCDDSGNSSTENVALNMTLSNPNGMNTADWRWAADKGFWDPIRRCWNEQLGGMQAYISQRNQRRAARLAQLKKGLLGANRGTDESCIKNRRPKIKKPLPKTGQGYNLALTHSMHKTAVVDHPNTLQVNWWNSSSLGSQNTIMNASTYSASSLQDSIGVHWPQLICRRFWTFGYSAQPIIAIFRDLPLELRVAMDEVLDAIQQCADAEERLRRNGFGETKSTPQRQSAAADEAAQWDHDMLHAFICVDLAPDTQDRVAVAFNARAADLLGLQPAELRASFATHRVPLALSPLDAVRCFLHSLRNCRSEATTRYCRVLLDKGRSAALVCTNGSKAFNACGQLCQVPRRRTPPPAQTQPA